jgi:hypothetical protein
VSAGIDVTNDNPHPCAPHAHGGKRHRVVWKFSMIKTQCKRTQR